MYVDIVTWDLQTSHGDTELVNRQTSQATAHVTVGIATHMIIVSWIYWFIDTYVSYVDLILALYSYMASYIADI